MEETEERLIARLYAGKALTRDEMLRVVVYLEAERKEVLGRVANILESIAQADGASE